MSRILFQLTALAATVFIITILALVATLIGDPAAPINDWFNRNGTTLLIVEVVSIIVFGLAAMTADRQESKHAKPAAEPPKSPPGEAS
jgi:hypothetical protein